MKLRNAEQAEILGTGVGRAAADMLRIEIVAAVFLRNTDMLDECCRPRGPFDGPLNDSLRTDAGEFAADFERGFWDGMRGRCGEIVDRLNADHAARLPVTETVDDGFDGD
jgi:hypothetical protein